MNLFEQAFHWMFSDQLAESVLPLGKAIFTHLGFSLLSLLIAAAIAVPLGWFIGHTGRARNLVISATGAARALPSFGLVLFLVVLFGVDGKALAVYAALTLLAVPPILAGAYSGVEAAPKTTVDGARAIGMSEAQILFKVEAPLGLPLLFNGLRTALLQIIASVTIAGYVGAWGLGFYIVQGIALRRFDQVLGASLVTVALAVIADVAMALVRRLAIPKGVRLQSVNE